MGNWRHYMDEQPRHYKRKIDKNKFCKKNKIGPNKYGPHQYEDNVCINCNKKQPGTGVIKLDFKGESYAK